MFFLGGVSPPLRVMMQKGLEQRLLELLQLQSPNVQLLTQRPTAQLQGTPFYFFAPKAETTDPWTHEPNMWCLLEVFVQISLNSVQSFVGPTIKDKLRTVSPFLRGWSLSVTSLPCTVSTSLRVFSFVSRIPPISPLFEFRDQSSSFTELNDRLSCHGAHGMGEKNTKSPFHLCSTGNRPSNLDFWFVHRAWFQHTTASCDVGSRLAPAPVSFLFDISDLERVIVWVKKKESNKYQVQHRIHTHPMCRTEKG